MRFFAALQFLTTIPVFRRREFKPEDLGRSAGYFPIVGLVIGLLLAGLSWLFLLFLPPAIATALLIVALVIITGALHLDGFVDICDGIGGQKTAEDRWRVMHDSRAGGFGIIGIVLLLLVKYVSLGSIPEPSLMAALVLMPVLSRWAMVYSIFAYSYALPAGLGKSFKQGTNWLRFTMATTIALVLAVALFQLIGLALIFLTWVVTVIAAAYFKDKFSGLTGDTYGAINELAEVSVLIFIVIFAQFGLA
ncbi:adenosylcobinamide-GDP ribazoletransferase [Chloroflexota bacterium]